MCFAQHSQQRMMAWAAMFARIVAFQRPLLPTVTFEHGGIQIQRVAVSAPRQPRHLPLSQRLVEALHVFHTEMSKQVANGVVDGEPFDPQQSMQCLIAVEQRRMRKAFGAHQHRDQEGDERDRRINVVR